MVRWMPDPFFPLKGKLRKGRTQMRLNKRTLGKRREEFQSNDVTPNPWIRMRHILGLNHRRDGQ